MFGFRLIFILAIVGGAIAFIGDKLGSKIGKKRLSVFGLRPKYTSILFTVITGILIAATSVIMMAIASDSARTAMFGMEKIQKELRTLNDEKVVANKELGELKSNLSTKNQEIQTMNEEIVVIGKEKEALQIQAQEARESLLLAQTEVGTLTEAKQQLETEVDGLEKTQEQLRRGIVAMREGHVVFRSGEVIMAGILRGGLNDEDNQKQLNRLLMDANSAAMQRMGIAKDKEVNVILLPATMTNQALKAIQARPDTVFVRVRAMANIISGEPALCALELADNEKIYQDNQLILSKVIDTTKKEHLLDQELLLFLTEVNHTAVKDGVIQDPISGKVGQLDAGTMVQTGEKLATMGGKVTISAYAKGDIYSSGPVLLNLEVVRYVE